jgi:hypothetical protein
MVVHRFGDFELAATTSALETAANDRGMSRADKPTSQAA